MATYTHPVTGEVKEYVPYAELTNEQRTWADSGDHVMRQTAAERGWGLDVLVDDLDWRIRKAVAEQGYGLGKLVDDPDVDVRRAVAEQGYGLDQLYTDESRYIREVCALHGFRPLVMVKDEDSMVRYAAAQHIPTEMLYHDLGYEMHLLAMCTGYFEDDFDPDRASCAQLILADKAGLISVNDTGRYVAYNNLSPLQLVVYSGLVDKDYEALAEAKVYFDTPLNLLRSAGDEHLLDSPGLSFGLGLDRKLRDSFTGYYDYDELLVNACIKYGYAIDFLFQAKDLEADRWLDTKLSALSEDYSFFGSAYASEGGWSDSARSQSLYESEIEEAYKQYEHWRNPYRYAAEKYLKEQGLTLEEWVAANPNNCALPENQVKAPPPTLDGAKAAQKNRPKIEQGGSGPKQ